MKSIINDNIFNMPSSYKVTLTVLMLFGIAACKNTDNLNTGTSSAEKSNLEAIYWARVDSARMNFTDADVNFMVGMIGHHAQALIMSRMAPTHGAHEQVQTLAARIINAQKAEIATMQRWLKLRGQPVPQVHIEGLTLMLHGVDNHHHNHMNMPGMLSPEQLQELDAAYGTEFDRLFLTYMIQHHQGAVFMVDKLVSTPGAARGTATYTLASGINVDQQTEIARMKRMLEDLPDL